MQQTEVAASKLLEWRRDPEAFVREVFGVIPDKWQSKALALFPKSPRLAMKACKGPGKTALLAWIGWNFMATRPHAMVGCTSISGDNLKANLWTELARWRAKSKMLQAQFEQTKTEIFHREYRQTWRMEARTWAKDADESQAGNALAGLHAPYVMWLMDETGDYPDAIMPTAEAIFAGDPIEAHIVQAGNPTALKGPLYRACTVARRLWQVVEITADPDDPDRTPRISIEHARAQIEQYGRDNPWVKVQIFGKFPDASFNALIGPDEVATAQKRYYREHELRGSSKVLGVDVARFGDDASVACSRQGLQVFPFRRWRNVDSIQGAGAVSRLWQDFGADACFVDDTGGYGAGWIDQLLVLKRSPIGVGFAKQAHNPQRFYNKRAEMYWDAVTWIKRGGALPEESPELAAALTQTTYTFQGDKMLLEPKDIIKVRLGYSPDDADAFCFVAGTLIATPDGSVPIEKLAPGDWVLTPLGEAQVAKLWETTATKLAYVSMSDGSYLEGRPEHKIFVYGHGLVRLDALSLTMAISPFRERFKWVAASALFTSIRSIGFKVAVATFPRAILFSASACCIAVCGLSIMGQSQKVMRSIIKMMIGGAAKLATSNCSPKLGTMLFIPVVGANSENDKRKNITTSNVAKTKQENGTVLPKDWIGIGRTALRLGKTENHQSVSASDVERNSNRFSQRKPNIAQVRANSILGFGAISQTFAYVHGAIRNLLQTVIYQRRVVPVHVAIENVEPTLVYNLTLTRDNAYYANGVLVFNCLTFAEPVMPSAPIVRRAPQRAEEYNPYAEAPMDRGGGRGYNSRDWG